MITAVPAPRLRTSADTPYVWINTSAGGRGTASADVWDIASSLPYSRAGGVVYSAGETGRSLLFAAGASDAVLTRTLPGSLANLTIIARIRSALATQASFAGIVFGRSGVGPTGINFQGDGQQLGYIWNNSFFGFASGLTPTANKWCSVALTVSSTAATLYLCPEGGTPASAVNTATHTAFAGITGGFKLGQDDNGGRVYSGDISDVKIWLDTLPATQIYRHMADPFLLARTPVKRDLFFPSTAAASTLSRRSLTNRTGSRGVM